jgi:hypothetical protein
VYQSTFVRYERRGDRVVPVRVTKQWVSAEVRGLDNRKEPKVVRKFLATRITELRMSSIRDREVAVDTDPAAPSRIGKPVAWASSNRVETRSRLMTLSERGVKDGEPLVREAGYDQCWLPYSVPANPTLAQSQWSLENGNGWLPPREDKEAA